MIADGSQIADRKTFSDRLRSAIRDPRSSAIVCDHMETRLKCLYSYRDVLLENLCKATVHECETSTCGLSVVCRSKTPLIKLLITSSSFFVITTIQTRISRTLLPKGAQIIHV